MKTRLSIGFVCVVIVSAYFVVGNASSQSGSRTQTGSGTGSSSTGNPTRPQQTFEERFWDFLNAGRHRYDYWGPFEGKVDMYEGQSPHGAFLRVYANRAARTGEGEYPINSIIIKENYGDDGETLAAITVMYKVEDFDPENGDWFYVKFNHDGTVAEAPADAGGGQLSGRVQSCIDCHQGAGGGDFVFLND